MLSNRRDSQSNKSTLAHQFREALKMSNASSCLQKRYKVSRCQRTDTPHFSRSRSIRSLNVSEKGEHNSQKDKKSSSSITMSLTGGGSTVISGIQGPPGRSRTELDKMHEEAETADQQQAAAGGEVELSPEEAAEIEKKAVAADVQEKTAAAQQRAFDSHAGEEEEFDFPTGTILEAAFVDPAYSWPPKDGEGRNAIELQASVLLLNDNNAGDDDSMATTETEKRRMRMPRKPKLQDEGDAPPPKARWWKCCRNNDAVVDTSNADALREYQERKIQAKEARKSHKLSKREKLRQKEKEYRRKNKYNSVPEGILVYRLDTSTAELSLMSQPHAETDLHNLIVEMKVAKARPNADKSRRGIDFEGEDGTIATLVACEQRTATAWLEAASIMLAKKDPKGFLGGKVRLPGYLRLPC